MKVLFGDSTPSSLQPDILEVVSKLVLCVRDVGRGVAEITDVLHQCDETTDETAAIVAELDGFLRQSEIGLRATATASKRPELAKHGEDAIAAIRRMVEGWRQSYLGRLEAQTQNAGRRTDELQAMMSKALETFLLPLRHAASDRKLRRIFDGGTYQDTATVEPLVGIMMELALRDSEPEVPRKVRSLVGKGARFEIGTKLSRILRNEEPAFVSLDDMHVVDAEITPERVRLQLAKKAGAEVVQIEIVRAVDGMRGAGCRADGVRATLPITDRPVMEALFTAMQAEARRVFAGPAEVCKISLEDEELDNAATMLELAQRLVDLHRPMIAELAAHSPNDAELSIKLETPEGKREEQWLRRDELAQHLLSLPASVLARLTIPELYPDMDVTGGVGAPESGAIHHAHTGNDSERIDLGALAAAMSGAPGSEVTEDISLHDLLLDSDVIGLNSEPCAAPARVQSRSSR